MTGELERRFNDAMLSTYEKARTIGYSASRFRQMLEARGGVDSAKHLLTGGGTPAGFNTLKEKQKLEWSVEALVLRPEWGELFTESERQTAWRRLADAGFERALIGIPSEGRPDLSIAISEIHRRVRDFAVGNLQRIRQEIKGLHHPAITTIFARTPLNSDWTFHHGGRSELQFNIGIEQRGWREQFRHGVAFSLEPSRSAPDIVERLLPKIARFNDFLRLNPETFADFRMWVHQSGHFSEDQIPGPIAPEIAQDGSFIMLGRRLDFSQIDYDLVAADFERLLALYLYVEGAPGPALTADISPPPFAPGHNPRKTHVRVTLQQQVLDITLRHGLMQDELYRSLVARYGSQSVQTEARALTGWIDVVVLRQGQFWYYEIKTAMTAAACIRQAFPQLLEYSQWPGAAAAVRLTIVGEPPLDQASAKYLERLRERFKIPIYYFQLSLTGDRISEFGQVL